MEPNKPLNTEQKIELEMDKVIEFEQEDIQIKKLPYWVNGAILGLILFVIYFAYSIYWVCSINFPPSDLVAESSCGVIIKDSLTSGILRTLSFCLIFMIVFAMIGFIYGKIKNRNKTIS